MVKTVRRSKLRLIIFPVSLLVILIAMSSCVGTIPQVGFKVLVVLDAPSGIKVAERVALSVEDEAGTTKVYRVSPLSVENSFEITLEATGTYQFTVEGYDKFGRPVLSGTKRERILESGAQVIIRPTFRPAAFGVAVYLEESVIDKFELVEATLTARSSQHVASSTSLPVRDKVLNEFLTSVEPGVWDFTVDVILRSRVQNVTNSVVAEAKVPVLPGTAWRLLLELDERRGTILKKLKVEEVPNYLPSVQNPRVRYNKIDGTLFVTWDYHTRAKFFVYRQLKFRDEGTEVFELLGETERNYFVSNDYSVSDFEGTSTIGVIAYAVGKVSELKLVPQSEFYRLETWNQTGTLEFKPGAPSYVGFSRWYYVDAFWEEGGDSRNLVKYLTERPVAGENGIVFRRNELPVGIEDSWKVRALVFLEKSPKRYELEFEVSVLGGSDEVIKYYFGQDPWQEGAPFLAGEVRVSSEPKVQRFSFDVPQGIPDDKFLIFSLDFAHLTGRTVLIRPRSATFR